MLFLLSPAKSLDFGQPPQVVTHTQPLFIKQASQLIKVLREKSPAQIAELMSLSDTLADLNVARYKAWSPRFTVKNAKQAVLAFNGDVYGGLNAKSLTPGELDWAQEHVCILSGLYGVLRPLDLLQPYRLEMGTRLGTLQGNNLYQFWGVQLADYLNQRAASDTTPLVVNLASEEYFRGVDRKALKARVVTCVFEEFRGGKYKVISFNAKRARGLMVRYAIEKRVGTARKLKSFDAEGYRFEAAVSGPDRLVFRRGESA